MTNNQPSDQANPPLDNLAGIPLARYHDIIATFRPLRTDDLTEAGRAAVGWRGRWAPQWMADDDHPYSGNILYSRVGPNGEPRTREELWAVAECDLADVVRVAEG